MTPTDLPCNVFVELVTDYLEGALSSWERALVDAHLLICSGCAAVLAQWRTVIDLAGRLGADDVEQADPDVRRSLVEAFRQLRPPSSP
jgi:predicted anti-sigma-YlaC factor YlaD